jgi:hypothetical protein
MFLFKSTHEALMKGLREQYELQLREQERSYERLLEAFTFRIEDLKSQLVSPTSATTIPREAIEADAIITVSEKGLAVDGKELDEASLREFDMIVGGEFEEGFN